MKEGAPHHLYITSMFYLIPKCTPLIPVYTHFTATSVHRESATFLLVSSSQQLTAFENKRKRNRQCSDTDVPSHISEDTYPTVIMAIPTGQGEQPHMASLESVILLMKP